jgi:hypothetical protein
MSKTKIPSDLRHRLEEARLDSLALFRGIDRLDLSAVEIPQGLLHALFELDADFAEALWALDQPPHALDHGAMVRDTLASLKRRPKMLEEFLARLPARAAQPLAAHRAAIRATLAQADAYYEIPGHGGG